jgi:hypothetical protein
MTGTEVFTVSFRAYAAHGQARHQTSCPVVEVPSNASLRDLITFSLTVLQELEVDTQSAISIPLLRYLTWFSGEVLEGTLAGRQLQTLSVKQA